MNHNEKIKTICQQRNLEPFPSGTPAIFDGKNGKITSADIVRGYFLFRDKGSKKSARIHPTWDLVSRQGWLLIAIWWWCGENVQPKYHKNDLGLHATDIAENRAKPGKTGKKQLSSLQVSNVAHQCSS